jgi:MFS family permease
VEQSARGELGTAVAMALALGWNLTSVGAIAEPAAASYGIGLAAVGLLGSALWLFHGLGQAPAGRLVDRIGPYRLGAIGVTGLMVTNLAALIAPSFALALPLRALTGACCSITGVAAACRAQGVEQQGWIGGAFSAGAAVAVAVGPALEDVLGWRAPYWGGAVIAAVVAVIVWRDELHGAMRPLVMAAHERGRLSDAYGLLARLGAVLACSLVLSFALGNWITTILARQGSFGSSAAGVVGALVVAGGAVTRPAGGYLARRWPHSGPWLVRGSLLAAAAASGLLILTDAPAVVVPTVAVLGLAAGMPFAVVVNAAVTVVPGRAGGALGILGTAGIIASFAAIGLLGLLVSGDTFSTGFGALAILALTSAAASWRAFGAAAIPPSARRGP